MNKNRTTGLAFGFGIGILIAAAIFGTSWVAKKYSSSIKTQAILPEEPTETTTPNTIQQSISTPATKNIDPQDNIVNRLAPAKEDVAADIQNNLQQLYGTKTTP